MHSFTDEELLTLKDFNLACLMGRRHIIEKLYDKTSHTFTWATSRRYTSVMNWLLDNTEISTLSGYCNLKHAAAHGHLEIVDWIYTNTYNTCIYDVVIEAVKNKNLNLLKWAYTAEKNNCISYAVIYATELGYIETIWVRDHLNIPEKYFDAEKLKNAIFLSKLAKKECNNSLLSWKTVSKIN